MAAPSTARSKSTKRGYNRKQPRLEVVQGGRVKSTQGERWNQSTAIESLDDAYIECRADGHNWETLGFFNYSGLITKKRRCSRCTTERTVRYRKNGAIVESTYTYPEGYQITGHGQLQAVHVRAVQLSRVTVFGSEADMLSHVLGNGKGRK